MPFNVNDGQSIQLNSSKSLLIRQLVLAFLYQERILEIKPDDSEDVKVVQDCLQYFNKPPYFSDRDYVTIDVKDCGAAYRFLMAVAAVTPGRWFITGTDRLLSRPVRPLVDALRSVGADIQPADGGWLVRGKQLSAKYVAIDCRESSQFASALLLISRRIGLQNIEIIPSPTPSAPYIQMTKTMLESCMAGEEITREADWSTAAFWYAFLALAPNVNQLMLNDLRMDSIQGDRVVAQWMTAFGISSTQTATGVLISKTGMAPDIRDTFQFDLTDHPDLAPVLAVFAALYPCRMRLTGLDSLNSKESRRLDVLVEQLASFAEIRASGGSDLAICGRVPETGMQQVVLDTHNDHRMALAFSLISLKYNILLTDVNCVRKSYPSFENYFIPARTFQK